MPRFSAEQLRVLLALLPFIGFVFQCLFLSLSVRRLFYLLQH